VSDLLQRVSNKCKCQFADFVLLGKLLKNILELAGTRRKQAKKAQFIRDK
jgi:hypothetical protein